MEDKRLEKIITIDTDLHRELKILAAKKGKTLRELAETAIGRFLTAETAIDQFLDTDEGTLPVSGEETADA